MSHTSLKTATGISFKSSDTWKHSLLLYLLSSPYIHSIFLFLHLFCCCRVSFSWFFSWLSFFYFTRQYLIFRKYWIILNKQNNCFISKPRGTLFTSYAFWVPHFSCNVKLFRIMLNIMYMNILFFARLFRIYLFIRYYVSIVLICKLLIWHEK